MKKLIILAILFMALSAGADLRLCDGALVSKNLDVGTTDIAIKSTQGYVCGWYLFNASASTRYFKFYNGTVSNVIVGTTAPYKTVPVPAGAAANIWFDGGLLYSTAITLACTTGLADNNSGAPTANDCVADVFYK